MLNPISGPCYPSSAPSGLTDIDTGSQGTELRPQGRDRSVGLCFRTGRGAKVIHLCSVTCVYPSNEVREEQKLVGNPDGGLDDVAESEFGVVHDVAISTSTSAMDENIGRDS